MGDAEPVPEERVKALLGRVPSKTDRERLAKVRDALGIRSTDAVWDIMIALDYHLQLYATVPDKIAEQTVGRKYSIREAGSAPVSPTVMWESRCQIRDLPPRPTTLPRTVARRARNRPSWYAVGTVIALLRFLFDLVLAFFGPHAALVAENLILRQQLSPRCLRCRRRTREHAPP